MKLAGVRVIELAPNLTAPLICMYMAEQGAEVIKIEPLPCGDMYRQDTKTGTGTMFRLVNHAKKSVAIDLSQPDGQEAVRRLIASADVFVTGYEVGLAEKRGLAYPALRILRPSLVYCEMSYFGRDGALSWFPAHDLSLQAFAGTLTRDASNRPCMPGVPAGLIAGAMTALSGILMALLHARETGRGECLDISLHDALMGWTTTRFAQLTDAGWPEVQTAKSNAAHPFQAVYETADGRWVAVSIPEPALRASLLVALGAQEFVESVGSGQEDPEVRGQVRTFLVRTFKTKSMNAWAAWAMLHRVPVAPVLEYAEALVHEQSSSRGLLALDAEAAPRVMPPYKFESVKTPGGGRAPTFGEHTLAVLRELGYSTRELEELVTRGAISNAG